MFFCTHLLNYGINLPFLLQTFGGFLLCVMNKCMDVYNKESRKHESLISQGTVIIGLPVNKLHIGIL